MVYFELKKFWVTPIVKLSDNFFRSLVFLLKKNLLIEAIRAKQRDINWFLRVKTVQGGCTGFIGFSN